MSCHVQPSCGGHAVLQLHKTTEITKTLDAKHLLIHRTAFFWLYNLSNWYKHFHSNVIYPGNTAKKELWLTGLSNNFCFSWKMYKGGGATIKFYHLHPEAQRGRRTWWHSVQKQFKNYWTLTLLRFVLYSESKWVDTLCITQFDF